MATNLHDLGGLRGEQALGKTTARRCSVLPRAALAGVALAFMVSACSSGGEDESFPSLSSVPEQPRSASAAEEREKTSEELQADLQRGTAGEAQPRAAGTATEATVSQTEQAAAAVQAPASGGSSLDGETAVISSEGLSSGTVAGVQAGTSETGDGNASQAWNPQRSELAAIIYFNHGSFDLNSQDFQVLEGVSALYNMRGGKVRVVGHSSARTKTASAADHRIANFDMSVSRADAVASALYEIGLPTKDVITEAKSDAQPVYHEFMPTGEAGNRRVEIFLEK